jgi:hypothetical protein
MRLPLGSWSRRERILLAACSAALALSVAALLGVGSGVSAAGQQDRVTSKEIANNTIRSVDVGKGKLRASDLGIYVVDSEIARNPGKGAGTTVYAACNEGDVILGGGGSWLGGGPGLETAQSIPQRGSGGWYWYFTGNDYGGPSNMYATAICMKN